jgi:methylthioribose-1-phosphate isomerase
VKVNGESYESIWLDEKDSRQIRVIDQRKLPYSFEIITLSSVEDVFNAISNMTVRGAPLIGAAGAFGIYLACLEMTSKTRYHDHISNAARFLVSARPTAVNLEWALKVQLEKLAGAATRDEMIDISRETAIEIASNEARNCKLIGKAGIGLIEDISRKKGGEPVNILTHCNAGWLACVDYGTATAPIYLAHDRGIAVHVWVDETRPRNQGSRLTAFELGQHGVPYTIISDNAGGLLMQKGMVDIVIVGCDRASASGDVANKIGTYLKALAAKDSGIPFYSALPTSTIDRSIKNGLKEIVIEEREERELTHIEGWLDNELVEVGLCPAGARASNYGFDITPSRLINGLITEKGIVEASKNGINSLFK